MRTSITVLTLAALCSLALVTPAQAAPVPVASWELSETSGRTMYDSSPNRISGNLGSRIVFGQTTYGFFGPTTPDDQRLVLVPDDSRLDPGTGTYAVTVRFVTTDGSPNIVQKGQAKVAGGFWKVVLNSGYPRCEFRDGTGKTLRADLVGTAATNKANDGYWHVVRCELSATGLRVTLDPGSAAEATKLTTGTHGRIDNLKPVSIGGKADCGGKVGCDYFTGSIDYIRINRF